MQSGRAIIFRGDNGYRDRLRQQLSARGVLGRRLPKARVQFVNLRPESKHGDRGRSNEKVLHRGAVRPRKQREHAIDPNLQKRAV